MDNAANQILFVSCSVLAFVISAQLSVVVLRYFRAKKLVHTTNNFEQHNHWPTMNVLFLGDSTACGVGASSAEKSVAGLLAQDLPNAKITNKARSGYRVSDVLRTFKPHSWDYYDLIVIQVGANDIRHGTNLTDLTLDLSLLFDRAGAISQKVILLTAGDIGKAPIYPWPMDQLLHYRSWKFHHFIKSITDNSYITYIDLIHKEQHLDLQRHPHKWYASDGLHPNDALYAFWYQQLKEALRGELWWHEGHAHSEKIEAGFKGLTNHKKFASLAQRMQSKGTTAGA